jgi:hypothetical protein
VFAGSQEQEVPANRHGPPLIQTRGGTHLAALAFPPWSLGGDSKRPFRSPQGETS